MKEMFSDIAFSAISVLITLIAIYLSVRLLGKLAKFVICIVIIAFLIWLFVSDNSILSTVMSKF
ncbi:MAG: hypothetical protein IKM08_04935 [Clostridia bacterium]|nr:hypothetical protein [Clostridia bacterium]